MGSGCFGPTGCVEWALKAYRKCYYSVTACDRTILDKQIMMKSSLKMKKNACFY